MAPQTGDQRLQNLVDALFQAIPDTSPKVTALVGHRFPDDDVWLCFWIAKKFIPNAADAELIFVNAGTSLSGSENDPSVIHFDTGGGQYDQHTQDRGRTCSAAILAERLQLLQDPGLTELIEMVTKVDNVEPLARTNIHYAIEGYPRLFHEHGDINWKKVQERVFELFDIIYAQETRRAQAKENLSQHATWTILPNGLKVATLLWHPELRDAAFEQGADVVLWTVRKGNRKFYVGIQRSRNLNGLLSLRGTAVNLRAVEAQLRSIRVNREDLGSVGREGPVFNWFLHPSLGLILNGSRTWTPTAEEYTNIRPSNLATPVLRALSAIPQDQVASWRTQG